MSSRLLAVPLVGLCLIATTACGGGGGGNAADFTKAYKPINTSLVKLAADIGGTLGFATRQSNGQIRIAFDRYANRLDKLNDLLEDTDPPSDLKDDVDDLSDAMTATAKDMRSIAEAAKTNDPNQAQTATRAFIKDSVSLGTARRKVAKGAGIPTVAPKGDFGGTPTPTTSTGTTTTP